MEYTCSMCGESCISDWSQEEAVAEKERDFGDVPLEECDQVCDVCYQKISPANNPDVYADYLRATQDKPIRISVPLPSQTSLDDTEAIRAYVDAELVRALADAMDRWEAEELFGVSRN